jgi:nitrogen regulatory protein PII
MTTNEHEVIFAIINSGYADEAMAVARENGARGGTIINARGVAGKEAAAFFGITFHEDKEILMLVVGKEQRDGILNALYQQMGMGKKARGIAFSLPVSNVAGLVKDPEESEAS